MKIKPLRKLMVSSPEGAPAVSQGRKPLDRGSLCKEPAPKGRHLSAAPPGLKTHIAGIVHRGLTPLAKYFRPFGASTLRTTALALVCACCWQLAAGSPAWAAAASFAGVIEEVEPKIVKIYGAGGYRGLEPYQSGMLISAEGHILTV